MGGELSRQTVDILGNLQIDDVLFEQSPIAPAELDDYKAIVGRLKKQRLHQLSEQDRDRLLAIALRYIPGRHKMVGMPEMIERLILEGRALFREQISAKDPGMPLLFTILMNIFIHRAY